MIMYGKTKLIEIYLNTIDFSISHAKRNFINMNCCFQENNKIWEMNVNITIIFTIINRRNHENRRK